MKRYRLIYLILIVFACCACVTDVTHESDEFESFEITLNIQGERVLNDELGWQINVVGSYLICEQEVTDNDNSVYHVFDSETLDFLGTAGLRGQGPNEFTGAQYSGQFYNVGDQTVIWVNDAPKYAIRAINLHESISSGVTKIEKSLKHHPKHNLQNNLFVLGSSDLAGYQPGYVPGTNITPLNIVKRGVIEGFGEYPRVKNEGSVSGGGESFRNLRRIALRMKPDQQSFVVAMRYYDQLDLFDNDGSLTRSIKHSDNYSLYDANEILDANRRITGLRQYYKTLDVTDNYIYALYYNRKVERGGIEFIEKRPSQIRVFDWDGNPKFLLECPDDLVSLSVDEERGWLYGHDISEERFMRYDISKMFK
ncbi:BF3164 family lipoprotein [Roseivirga sp.]|uniref:BF3164 family lipoprotein n=1 Tax=Roseivirga sp. TaxID=1964215 RepID=UPI003B8DD943